MTAVEGLDEAALEELGADQEATDLFLARLPHLPEIRAAFAPPGSEPPPSDHQPSRIRKRLIRGADVFHLPAPSPLITDWLYRRTLAVTYAHPKRFKTFVVLDQALSIATGRDWHGHPVEAGPVLYVAAEGASGLGRRISAWLEHHQLEEDALARFMIYPERVNLLDDASVIDLATVAGEEAVALVVLDTLARCMPGGDENSGRDMGRAIDALDMVRTASGACVMAVHHAGKDVAKGMRGHSSLWGAIDTGIEVDRPTRHRVTLAVTDQKDAEPPAELQLQVATLARSLVLTRAARDDRTTVRPEALVRAMERLSDVIIAQPGLGKSAARSMAKGNSDTLKAAIEALEAGGWLEPIDTRPGKPHLLTMLRPYRGINDPLAPDYDAEAEVPPPCRPTTLTHPDPTPT